MHQEVWRERTWQQPIRESTVRHFQCQQRNHRVRFRQPLHQGETHFKCRACKCCCSTQTAFRIHPVCFLFHCYPDARKKYIQALKQVCLETMIRLPLLLNWNRSISSDRVIPLSPQIFDAMGTFVRKIGSEGDKEGQLKFPRGVTTDEDGKNLQRVQCNQQFCLLAANYISRYLMLPSAPSCFGYQESDKWGNKNYGVWFEVRGRTPTLLLTRSSSHPHTHPPHTHTHFTLEN